MMKQESFEGFMRQAFGITIDEFREMSPEERRGIIRKMTDMPGNTMCTVMDPEGKHQLDIKDIINMGGEEADKVCDMLADVILDEGKNGSMVLKAASIDEVMKKLEDDSLSDKERRILEGILAHMQHSADDGNKKVLLSHSIVSMALGVTSHLQQCGVYPTFADMLLAMYMIAQLQAVEDQDCMFHQYTSDPQAADDIVNEIAGDIIKTYRDSLDDPIDDMAFTSALLLAAAKVGSTQHLAPDHVFKPLVDFVTEQITSQAVAGNENGSNADDDGDVNGTIVKARTWKPSSEKENEEMKSLLREE